MYYDGSIRIEEDDQCYTCQYFCKGVSCPLLEALGLGVVALDGEVQVKNCGFYKEFKRHLKLIDPARLTEPLPDDEENGPEERATKP
jgi:hypothetical protein